MIRVPVECADTEYSGTMQRLGIAGAVQTSCDLISGFSATALFALDTAPYAREISVSTCQRTDFRTVLNVNRYNGEVCSTMVRLHACWCSRVRVLHRAHVRLSCASCCMQTQPEHSQLLRAVVSDGWWLPPVRGREATLLSLHGRAAQQCRASFHTAPNPAPLLLPLQMLIAKLGLS